MDHRWPYVVSLYPYSVGHVSESAEAWLTSLEISLDSSFTGESNGNPYLRN